MSKMRLASHEPFFGKIMLMLYISTGETIGQGEGHKVVGARQLRHKSSYHSKQEGFEYSFHHWFSIYVNILIPVGLMCKYINYL